MPQPPARPRIYHIVHVDRLASIIGDGRLSCDAAMLGRQGAGTTIGMSDIKKRRLDELSLSSRPGLRVGGCVPFYFCPRSVMLYIISRQNHPSLPYRGGQEPVVHLEADLHAAVTWAEAQELRWAFTLSNAGSRYFEDRCDLSQLHEINWPAVAANWWQGEFEDGKQAEFLLERRFPWELVERIGVHSQGMAQQVANAMRAADHRPRVEIRPDWYY
jgi:ssDNA thymidine ADP-ribosyltransferase, DarT